MKLSTAIGLLISLLLSFAAGWFGSRFPPGLWYAELTKPAWTPPNYIFGPAWTTLYILMAVSAWLVWKKVGFRSAAVPLTVYLLQLFLNALWSYLFFGLHNTGLALINICFLWLAILMCTILFYRHHRIAAYLLVPYLIWVSYAAALNFEIWRIN